MSQNKLNKVLERINARLALHNGGVELVSFDRKDQKLSLRLKGACQGCPMAQLTTENFIRKELERNLPQIKDILIT